MVQPHGRLAQIDLGDVNDDGDLEIIAIGSEGGNTRSGVFDPVIASGITDPNKKINGIPWDTLYEETFVGSPGIVVAGNFDNAIPGDEFAFSYQDTSGVTRVIVMNAASLGPNGKPTGRDWKQHVEYIDPVSGREWRFAASGNINGVGSDEIVLVDSKSSTTRFDVFDVDQGFLRIDGKNSSSDTIRKVAVGQVKTGGSDEIVEIRTTKPSNDALRVYEWDTSDGELDTIKGWAFAPQPDAVFLADLAGNGDQEILFLRSHPSEDAPRLIMLNEWGDDQKTLIDIEISLADIEGGKDDRFKIGAGGDIDGDGRDEIVIASDTRIVVFNDPHRTVGADSRTEYLLPTNNDTLKVGDLDAMGFIEGPMFGTDKNLVSAAVPTGTSGGADTVLLTNITTGQSVDYFVIQNLPPWLTVNPMFGATPANITFNFDATNLQIGVYRHTVQLSSNANVVNKPYSIEVVLTVEPATLLFQPGAAGFTYFPCEPPVNITSTMEIEVGGTVGLSFHAAILLSPNFKRQEQVRCQARSPAARSTTASWSSTTIVGHQRPAQPALAGLDLGKRCHHLAARCSLDRRGDVARRRRSVCRDTDSQPGGLGRIIRSQPSRDGLRRRHARRFAARQREGASHQCHVCAGCDPHAVAASLTPAFRVARRHAGARLAPSCRSELGPLGVCPKI